VSTATAHQGQNFVYDRDFEAIANQQSDLDGLLAFELDNTQTGLEDDWIANDSRPVSDNGQRELRRLLRHGKRPEQTPRYKTIHRANAQMKRLIATN
jgi:hypothetical protein